MRPSRNPRVHYHCWHVATVATTPCLPSINRLKCATHTSCPPKAKQGTDYCCVAADKHICKVGHQSSTYCAYQQRRHGQALALAMCMLQVGPSRVVSVSTHLLSADACQQGRASCTTAGCCNAAGMHCRRKGAATNVVALQLHRYAVCACSCGAEAGAVLPSAKVSDHACTQIQCPCRQT